MNIIDNLFPVEASILSSDAINEILASEYSTKHKIVRCRLYYRSIHDTYLVISDKVNLYLKVYRYGLRTKEEIQSEIDLLIHLCNCGIHTTEPIIKNDGSFIIEFNTVQGTRYGVLYTSVGLKSFAEVSETDLLNEKLGEYVSSIHCAWDNLEAKKNVGS